MAAQRRAWVVVGAEAGGGGAEVAHDAAAAGSSTTVSRGVRPIMSNSRCTWSGARVMANRDPSAARGLLRLDHDRQSLGVHEPDLTEVEHHGAGPLERLAQVRPHGIRGGEVDLAVDHDDLGGPLRMHGDAELRARDGAIIRTRGLILPGYGSAGPARAPDRAGAAGGRPLEPRARRRGLRGRRPRVPGGRLQARRHGPRRPRSAARADRTAVRAQPLRAARGPGRRRGRARLRGDARGRRASAAASRSASRAATTTAGRRSSRSRSPSGSRSCRSRSAARRPR